MNRKCDAHTHPFEKFKSLEGMRKFADSALAQGLEEIIFTEHAPINPALNPTHGMSMAELESYWQWANFLKAEYDGRLSIRIGLEIDYHPDNLEYSQKVISMFPFEYLSGSVHLHVPFWQPLIEGMTSNEYVRFALTQTCCAIETELFDAITHLDFFRWKASEYNPAVHENEFREVFRKLQEHDVALELNTSGRDKVFSSFLPCDEVWQWSLEYPLKRVLGSDAHLPENVGKYFADIS